MHAAFVPQPLRHRGVVADVLVLTYLSIFGLYLVWTAVHFVLELREMREVRWSRAAGDRIGFLTH